MYMIAIRCRCSCRLDSCILLFFVNMYFISMCYEVPKMPLLVVNTDGDVFVIMHRSIMSLPSFALALLE